MARFSVKMNIQNVSPPPILNWFKLSDHFQTFRKNRDKLLFIGWLQGQNIGLFQRDSISDREQQDNHSYIGAANNNCITMGDGLTELAKYLPINHQVQSNCSQLYRDFAEYPQLSSWALLSIQGARDPREAVLVLGRSSSEMRRSALLDSSSF